MLCALGNDVICVDVDPSRVERINAGVPPIYEEGLEQLLHEHAGKNLRATLDYDMAIANTDISFICVPTPCDEDGKIDLRFIREASRSIGRRLKDKKSYHVVVVKSTVVPGTTEKVVTPILEEESGKKVGKGFGVGMNPEFLREGKAVHDFRHPDRIVIGADDPKAAGIIKELYAGYSCPVLEADTKTAEMIKYVSNAFLATKISFSNEVGNICKRLGIDTYKVMEGVGLDARISPHFLRSGPRVRRKLLPQGRESPGQQSIRGGLRASAVEDSAEGQRPSAGDRHTDTQEARARPEG